MDGFNARLAKGTSVKILFLVPHPIEAASYRYRVHQFLPYLDEAKISYRVRPFVSEKFYKILYKKGHLIRKIYFTLKGLGGRLRDLLSLPQYDLIFIHLETSPFPALIIERIAKLLGKPIIFDFDDAIFLKRRYATHRFRNLLRSHRQPSKLIRLSTRVLVCNPYLADFARQHIEPSSVTVLPTVIDTRKFTLKKPANPIPVIGWIGMHTTFPYLEAIQDILSVLAQRYTFKLKIVGAPQSVAIPGVTIIQKEWKREEEISDYYSLDIGLYPLMDPQWDQGKASFKALLYMASYVPCVASNIGRNRDVIADGVNGYLVDNKQQWLRRIEALLKSPDLRQRIARMGRETVETRFSMEKYAPLFVDILKSVNV